ncbi:hypothetical protein JOF53_008191 [Crossiella equi]|uniref:GXWXG protein n=1 Tax=Crossiella equi TaxID=130796 RepID=A0ABS5ASZ6_9PSEU|nr:DUF4334 domain-containing protein [Crossiella equi]MBP2479319.1 hypothetical protein [Crossiella equi]
MDADQARQELRRQLAAHPADYGVLEEVWDRLDPVAAEDILGRWRGTGFDTGHHLYAALGQLRWHGKHFHSVQHAQPLVCRDDNGELYSAVELGKGEASLWNVEFRGEVTATMVYDGQPVLDHFRRVDEDTLLGVMNGKAELVLHEGRHFYFLLERD